MDRESSTSHDVLERMLLDESAEPTNLPLSLLEQITNHFSLDQQIGIGGFAVVYKGKVGKGLVAVKKLSNTFGVHENKFQEEVKCMIKAKHKNIVRLLGYCADTQGKMEIYERELVMAEHRNWLLCFEYVCNGSLDKHITDVSCGLNWKERYRIIRGICEGLLFLHEKRILHLDLKPANILLDGHMVPKICDFGISRCLSEEQTRAITKSQCGTLGYMDPEYIKSGQLSFASDIYSLGVIILEILTGVKWYLEEENVVESWMNRLEASERDMELEQVRVCTKIGIECMNLDPKKRPDARRIIDRLDETASVDYSYETGMSSSQWGQKSGKVGAESLHKADSFWEARDRKRKAKRHGVNWRRTLGQSDNIKIFRKDELESILKRSNLVGEGDLCKVYKGVVDNAHVAVKKPVDCDATTYNLLANAAIIQSQVIHKNILRLIGCCLEMDAPILVYEFISNGSMHDILLQRKKKKNDSKVPLSLDVRLPIAAELAQGLAYLHSQLHPKIIVHGDFRPANIFLDQNLMPKITGFGLSMLTAGNKQYIGRTIGVMTYMDPVFLQTGLLTQNGDVYSFGIVILEVISRKKARISGDDILVRSFFEVRQRGEKATNLFDKEIAVTTIDLEILDSLAEMALECVNLDVYKRPTMSYVAERLLALQRYYRSQVVHQSPLS